MLFKLKSVLFALNNKIEQNLQQIKTSDSIFFCPFSTVFHICEKSKLEFDSIDLWIVK